MSNYKTECDRCGTELAKNDDARREEDGCVYYLCDGCIADDNGFERECLCGTTIPAYGDHEDFEPQCRHCERTLLTYFD